MGTMAMMIDKGCPNTRCFNSHTAGKLGNAVDEGENNRVLVHDFF